MNQEQLFNEIIALKHDIQSMASIVQNPTDIPKEQLIEWYQNVDKHINNVIYLRDAVVNFYSK